MNYVSNGGASMVVKGISKRVVVVRFPDTRVFEQAIFLLRDGDHIGVSEEQILKEAGEAAAKYLHRGDRKRTDGMITKILLLLSGAAAACLVWVLAGLF
jgi:hypothetical protein